VKFKYGNAAINSSGSVYTNSFVTLLSNYVVSSTNPIAEKMHLFAFLKRSIPSRSRPIRNESRYSKYVVLLNHSFGSKTSSSGPIPGGRSPIYYTLG